MGLKAAPVPTTDAHLWGFNKADTGIYRILLWSTSIEQAGHSAFKVAGEWLKDQYGDAGEVTVVLGKDLGGITQTYQGWESQSYGGIGYYRRRGKSTSGSALTCVAGALGDEVIVQYSTEPDGGTTNVRVNGLVVGTINCNGAQSYSNRVTFNRAALIAAGVPTIGYLTVTLDAPASGYIYGELVTVGATGRTGMAFVDATLGGSSLTEAVVQGTPGGTAITGPAIVGYNGLDAYTNDAFYDAVWMGHVVNDAGTNPGLGANYNFDLNYKPLIDRAVANTATRNVPFILLVEPPGHWALSGASQAPDPTYYAAGNAQYYKIRDYLLGLGRANQHVKTVDWAGAIMVAPDVAASRYYLATGIDLAAGTWNTATDFIHPQPAGHQPGVALMCDALGIAPPPGVTNTDVQSRRMRTSSPVDGVGATALVGGWRGPGIPDASKRYPRAAGWAIDPFAISRVRKVPYYADEELGSLAMDVGVINTAVAGSGTTDVTYGAYKNYNQGALALGNEGWDFVGGDRITILMRVRNAAGGGTVINIRAENTESFYQEGNATPKDSGNRPYFNLNSPTPVWVKWEMGSTIASPQLVITGDVLEGYVVRNSSVGIITKRAWLTTPHLVGPPVRLFGDPDPFGSPALSMGQTYFEQLPDLTLQYGELIGHAYKHALQRAIAFTAAAATSTFTTATAHGFVNGDRVFLVGASLPTGVVAATTYYVVAAATLTFQLAATSGGTAITLTVDGSGTVVPAEQRVGLYRARGLAAVPSTEDGLVVARAGGTSQTSNPQALMNGGGEQTGANPARFSFGAQALAASYTTNSNRRTMVSRFAYTSTNGVWLKLINGANVYWLQPDGTWSAVATRFRPNVNDRIGENLAVTFDLPVTDATIGTAPTLNLEWDLSGLSTIYGTAVLSKGQRALTL